MKRDTIGNAGGNKCISLKVFVPSLTQYLADLSKRHASKILCPETGAHCFPSAPKVGTKLWGKIQKFNMIRLLLSVCDSTADARLQWQQELKFSTLSTLIVLDRLLI